MKQSYIFASSGIIPGYRIHSNPAQNKPNWIKNLKKTTAEQILTSYTVWNCLNPRLFIGFGVAEKRYDTAFGLGKIRLKNPDAERQLLKPDRDNDKFHCNPNPPFHRWRFSSRVKKRRVNNEKYSKWVDQCDGQQGRSGVPASFHSCRTNDLPVNKL